MVLDDHDITSGIVLVESSGCIGDNKYFHPKQLHHPDGCSDLEGGREEGRGEREEGRGGRERKYQVL